MQQNDFKIEKKSKILSNKNDFARVRKDIQIKKCQQIATRYRKPQPGRSPIVPRSPWEIPKRRQERTKRLPGTPLDTPRLRK